MRRASLRSFVLVAAACLLVGCDEVLPPEPTATKPVPTKVVKKPVAAAPVVKKKPVIVFDDGGDGGGGWN
jgi:hypothetical protein